MSRIERWLSESPRAVMTFYAMVAAFAAYASMYAFRKPFTATGYDGLTAFTLFGVAFSYKPIAIISQLLGYMGSKFIGIKVASEASMKRRVPLVLGLILFAELMLLMFASRTKRAPMDKAERRKFIRSYFPGVLLLMLGYLCLMTYRDLRDSFMDKILTDLNYTVDSDAQCRQLCRNNRCSAGRCRSYSLFLPSSQILDSWFKRSITIPRSKQNL